MKYDLGYYYFFLQLCDLARLTEQSLKSSMSYNIAVDFDEFIMAIAEFLKIAHNYSHRMTPCSSLHFHACLQLP